MAERCGDRTVAMALKPMVPADTSANVINESELITSIVTSRFLDSLN